MIEETINDIKLSASGITFIRYAQGQTVKNSFGNRNTKGG
jgi:hypothetical protein